MIVKIINGKTPSAQATIDYISDKNKTAKSFDELKLEYESSSLIQEELSLEEFYLANEDNINRALSYIANEDKIDGYISGYLCDPELADEQFRQTKEINLARVGKTLKDDTGNYFYHIIQSFPEELDISVDEVHQCGVELVERLGLYQAVITSHIHPAIDEEGEVHGKCKHNHIVINSHVYHELVDSENPYKMKYNNCKESYAQLQLINDQIAIEHGLPIIINQDKKHSYSWFESEERNKGRSWKKRVEIDINNAMKTSTDFDSFTKAIQAAGYNFRIGKSKTHGEYITYTCPDGEHKIRDYLLGKGYTKAQLESYWNIKKNINEELLHNYDLGNNRIQKLIETYQGELYIKFERNISDRRKKKRSKKNINIRNTYTNFLPLTSHRRNNLNAELSYFSPNLFYEIVDKDYNTITEVSGAEILDFFNQEHQKAREKEQQQQEEKNAYYSRYDFISSATKSPYKVRLWDKNGRKRSIIELIIILAVITIQNENGKWEPKTVNSSDAQEIRKRPIYAKKDWKVQNMLDSIKVASEENISNLDELNERLNSVGKETSKSKAELRRLTSAKNKMDVIYEAIETLNEVKEICEQIREMPDGPRKIELQQKHASEIEDYKYNKSILYRHKITNEAEIQDFLERYKTIQEKIPYVEAENERYREEYRRLSKLKYNVQLAQNKQYCYGPEYIEPDLEQEIEEPAREDNQIQKEQ